MTIDARQRRRSSPCKLLLIDGMRSSRRRCAWRRVRNSRRETARDAARSSVTHLARPDVGMIGRSVRSPLEGQDPNSRPAASKAAAMMLFELEVGLERRLPSKSNSRRAQLLRVVAPVPGRRTRNCRLPPAISAVTSASRPPCARAACRRPHASRAGRAPPPASWPSCRRGGQLGVSSRSPSSSRPLRCCSANISAMIVSRLSVAPPLSPRAIQALNACSRRSRRVENVQERLDARARQRSPRACRAGRARAQPPPSLRCARSPGSPARSSSPSSTRAMLLLVRQHVLAEVRWPASRGAR